MRGTAAGIFAENSYQFLDGGGEMGKLMRNKDWSGSAVGTPGTWPQSLCTTINILLNSKFPMFLWWGPHLTCFYNDAYRPSLGENGKHPVILGMAATEAWPEIWDIIGPLIHQVLNGGESIWREDQLIPIFRNGSIEDVYWTFSYSPVKDESGKIAGVLVTCNETTDKVITHKKLQESKDQLQFAIEAAELGTWDYNPATNTFSANGRLKDWFGLPPGSALDLSLALNAIAENDRQRIVDAIEKVLHFSSGGHFDEQYSIINPVTKKELIVRGIGQSWFDKNDIAYRFTGTLHNVTQQVIAQRKTEASEKSLRLIITQAPVAMCVFKGSNHILEIANDRMLELWGKTAEQVTGKPIFDGLPEARNQGLEALLEHVFNSGEKFEANEHPVNLPRNGHIETAYINFVYEPLKDPEGNITGILAIASDVSMQVTARKKIEESEEQLRIALDGGELGTFDYYPETDTLIWSEKTKEFFGLPPDAAVDLSVYLQAIHPDDREASKAIVEQQANLENGGMYELEYRVIGITNGKLRWLRSKGKASYNSRGIPVRYTGVIHDITERKIAAEALKESERKFRTMAESSDILIGVNDETGNATYFNQAWVNLTGRPVQEMLNFGWADLLHPEDRENFLEKFSQAFKTKESYNGEFRVLNRNGSYSWLYAKVPVRLHPDGSYAGHISSCIDITERKQAEEEIRRFKFMADNASEPFILIREDGSFEYLNKAAQESWGYTETEATQIRFPHVDILNTEASFKDFFTRAQKEQVPTFETLYKKKDGSIYPVEVNIAGFTIGCKPYLFAVARNISERKNAELALKESEQRLRSLVESAPFPIGVYVGKEMRIELVNDSILAAWGRTSDVVGKLYADVLTELTGQGVYEQLDGVFTTGTPFHATNQYLELMVDGKLQPYYYNYSFTPLYDNDGKVYGILNTAANVTDLNVATKKIEKSEKEFRQLADSLPALVWTTDSDGKQIFASERWKEFTGLDPYDESTFAKMVHPDDLANIINTWNDCLATENIYKAQLRLKSKNGDYQWFYANGEPVRDESGNIEKWIGAFNNINDQKKAETELLAAFQQLEESEKRFRNVANSAPVFIWMAGTDKLRNFFNTAWLKFTGRTAEQERGFGWAASVHPDDLEKCMDTYLLSFDKKDEYCLEYRLKRYDGEYRWISARGVPRFTADNIFEGYIGACMDIHEQVIAQKKLKEDEERLNIVINASELGTWELDLKKDEVNYSYRYLQIFGYRENVNLSHSQLLKHLHPDDLLIRGEAFADAMTTGFLQYESRIIWNDQSVHWIEAKGKVFYNENNKPTHLIGTLRDITDEKHYQQELMEREQKFRLLADSMPQFVWTSDAQGNMNYFNQSVYDYTGLSQEQIAESGWLQIVHPDDRDTNISAWMHSINTGTDFIFEHRFGRYDGEYRWQLSRAIPQKDAAGNIQMWVGTSTDIQEIKEQEQQKDFFISMASHELKTPITSMKGYVQLLQATYLNTEDHFLKKSLNVIEKQIATLTSLISDLLDVSKIKSGNLVLNKKDFEITEIIEAVISQIQQINPDFSISFSDKTPAIIYADEERISQVLINFLTNAVKYSPNSKNVKVRNLIEDNHLVVFVEDTGIGISKADQEKIFERFYRVEGKNEKTFPGFGIGLFIASEIIRRHHGKIGVTSNPGKGSVFYFSIPIEKILGTS